MHDVRLRVEHAANNATTWFEIGRRLQQDAGPPDDDPIWPFVWAFQYDLVEAGDVERRQRWGPFAPRGEFQDGVIPQPLETVLDSWLSDWAQIAADCASPAARARLFDLLWERKWGQRPDHHARAAIDAYLELASADWEPLHRAEGLIRALELARSIRDPDRTNGVLAQIIDAARVSMAQDQPQPGVALRLIEALLRLPRGEQPAAVEELLDTAAPVYEGDPWSFEAVLDLQATRTRDDPEQMRMLRLRQILRWREFATTTEGLVRLAHLEHALELARVHGLTDIADELRRDIQSIRPEELDLKAVTATVTIPQEQIDTYIAWFVSGADWRQCLTRFGAAGPPSGDYTKNLARVTEQMQQFPLQYLVKKVILSPDNVPIRIVASEEQHRQVALSEYEARSISVWALLAVDILKGIRERHGAPKARELTAFFTTELIPQDVAERMGRALLLYWRKQPDEAAHILLPRIEAVIRGLCRQLGHAIIREPVGEKPGGVRTLGDLISTLQGQMDESWRRYLWNLLVDATGLNLRNRALHGLLSTVSAPETALLLHVACHLRLIRVVSSDEQTS